MTSPRDQQYRELLIQLIVQKLRQYGVKLLPEHLDKTRALSRAELKRVAEQLGILKSQDELQESGPSASDSELN